MDFGDPTRGCRDRVYRALAAARCPVRGLRRSFAKALDSILMHPSYTLDLPRGECKEGDCTKEGAHDIVEQLNGRVCKLSVLRSRGAQFYVACGLPVAHREQLPSRVCKLSASPRRGA